jgi:hypothetical protein
LEEFQMNASELKLKIEQATEGSRFFSKENMRFAGDTMANFGVQSTNLPVEDQETTPPSIKEVVVWELYRKQPTRKGFLGSFYFRKDTYEQVRRAR